jgi:hypothetical protein
MAAEQPKPQSQPKPAPVEQPRDHARAALQMSMDRRG